MSQPGGTETRPAQRGFADRTPAPANISARVSRIAKTRTLMVSAAILLAAVIGASLYSEYRATVPKPPTASTPGAPFRVAQNIAFCRTSDGIRIAYATLGKRQALPVLEIVGWNSHLTNTAEDPYLKIMCDHYFYVRYDGRGSGLSDRGVRDFSIDARVRDVEAVMDALKLSKAALFGDSAGGATAIAYTARHPGRVSRLVLYGSFARWLRSAEAVRQWQDLVALQRSSWGSDNPAYRQMFASLFIPDATPSESRRFGEDEGASMTSEDAAAFTSASLNLDVTALAPKITVPTLVVHRRGDLLVPFEDGREIATLIPGARLLTLEGRNHTFVDSDPTSIQFVKAFIAFLNEDLQTQQQAQPGMGDDSVTIERPSTVVNIVSSRVHGAVRIALLTLVAVLASCLILGSIYFSARSIDESDAATEAVRAGAPAAVEPIREPPKAAEAGDGEALFRKEGEFWTIAYRGTTIRLKDAKGLHYLAWLLAHPGERIHVHDLVTAVEGGAPLLRSQAAALSEDLHVVRDIGQLGPTLDSRARFEYQVRMCDLRADLDEAERFNDEGRCERLRTELELVGEELSGATGSRGRLRAGSDSGERARAVVGKNIRATLEKIRHQAPFLGRHFATSITTGYFCAYQPEPDQTIRWRL